MSEIGRGLGAGSNVAAPDLIGFLSHTDLAAEVNLRVFDLLSEHLSLQFEVDEGLTATSTTRLERMIRAADAFVGVYPVIGDRLRRLTPEEAQRITRYFRLELDMAVRARKPYLVVMDRRLRGVLPVPDATFSHQYEAQELLSGKETLRLNELRRVVRAFERHARTATPSEWRQGTVGLVMPPGKPREAAAGILKAAHQVWQPDWPLALDLETSVELRQCEWVVVDTTTPESGSLIAYLRGQAIPFVRIRQGEAVHEADKALFGTFQHHYDENLVRWSEVDELSEQLRTVTDLIDRQPRLITDHEDARRYFQRASTRKEAVFLSYSAKDAEYAKQIGDALRKRFQQVFDYKVAGTIPFGSDWMVSLLESLSQSAIGVPLLSTSYIGSNYCLDEVRRMADARLRGKMRVFPIMLDETRLPELQPIEHWHASGVTPEMIVKAIIDDLDGTVGQGSAARRSAEASSSPRRHPD
ncbi:toll/interleukin-1 receptor domain-containing protein [Lentzea sp. NPDC054927]